MWTYCNRFFFSQIYLKTSLATPIHPKIKTSRYGVLMTDRQFIQTYTYSTSSQHKLHNEICHVYLHICEIKNEQISVSLTVTIKRKISYTLIDSHAHTRARKHTHVHARKLTHPRIHNSCTHAYT